MPTVTDLVSGGRHSGTTASLTLLQSLVRSHAMPLCFSHERARLHSRHSSLQHAAGTTYTCLFILVTASISGIKPGLATKPPASPQVRGKATRMVCSNNPVAKLTAFQSCLTLCVLPAEVCGK